MSKNAKIIIVILSLLIVGLITFIITDKILDGMSEKNVAQAEQTSGQASKNASTNSNKTNNAEKKKEESSEKEDVTKKEEDSKKEANSKIEKKEKDPVTTTETEKKDNKTTTDKKTTAVEAIKKALKDEKWRKENVMMKETCFGENASKDNQNLCFMRVVNANYEPMIIVEAYSEKQLSSQAFMVYYKNGKVVSTPMTEYPQHISHASVGVDPNKAVAIIEYMHMGVHLKTLYNIKNGNIEFKQEITEEYIYSDNEDEYKYYKRPKENAENIEITEAEYNKMDKVYDDYKFYGISTELTNSNIDKYVK